MKQTTTHTKNVWKSGDYAGPTRRPTVRATISRLTIRKPTYRLGEEKATDWAHAGWFRSAFFGQNQRPRELPNIQSMRWTRGVDTDVATATIVLANVQVRNDEQPHEDELDFPGYFTPNRGDAPYFDQWGYVKNDWAGWFVPDRVIHTYEGYGNDPSVAPEKDPYLYPSGVWLIDEVIIDAEGTITLECRDFGRLLMDQVIFPNAIPYSVHPLSFEPYEGRSRPVRTLQPAGGRWSKLTYQRDSNTLFKGKGLVDDDGSPVIRPDGTVAGHHGRDAFDGKTSTNWLSVGHRNKKASDAYAWIQGKLSTPGNVQAVRVRNGLNGPGRVYVSLQRNDGTWVGNKRVPYRQRGRNPEINANVPYVVEAKIKGAETLELKMPRQYSNIKAIRITIGSMSWTPSGYNLNYRAAVSELEYTPSMSESVVTRPYRLGNYGDYTNVVKWLLCWAGWFWPIANVGLPANQLSDGTSTNLFPASRDSALQDGRAWGDFEMTGTKGIAPLGVDVFDRRPFIDGIAAVREVVGYDFWIDETGGAVWRMPNIFAKGNYVMPIVGGPRTTRSTNLVEINERETLTSIQVRLNSKNVRERVLVANVSGKAAATVRGYAPESTGMSRIAGWTDQKFASADECERMADLIALKQAFTYRQSAITIAANPAIQPDDQVIITERTTGEGNVHRVLNITSEWSAETGQWTYQLTTNWLADREFKKLVFDPKKLRNITRVYLRHMKRL